MLRYAFIGWLLTGTAHAQFRQQQLREVPFSDFPGLSTRVVEVGQQGCVLFAKNETNAEVGKQRWYCTRFDTSLVQGQTLAVDINEDLRFVRTHTDSTYLYTLFGNATADQLLVLRLHLARFQFTFHPVQNKIPLVISDFKVLGNRAFVSGFDRTVPVALHFSLSAPNAQVLPRVYQPLARLNRIAIQLDQTHRKADVLLSSLKGRQSRSLWCTFDENGLLLQQLTLPNSDHHHLLDSKIIHLSDQQQLMVGSYADKSGDYAQGLYVAKWQAGEQVLMKFYPFADFEHFFDYLPARQRVRTQQKATLRKASGTMLRLYNRVVLHDILPWQDHFLVVADLYDAVENTNGGHTHAVLACFDAAGQLRWERNVAIPLAPNEPLPSPPVTACVVDNRAVVGYTRAGRMRIQTFDPNGNATDPQVLDIANADTSQLTHWYGRYWLSFGTRTPGDTKVPFLAKFSYQTP